LKGIIKEDSRIRRIHEGFKDDSRRI